MSARVQSAGWHWFCDECAEGGEETYAFEHEAEEHARWHDEDNHGTVAS
jgi:hypothetical protein